MTDKPDVNGWRNMDSAPRDGRPFLVRSGQAVFRAFYKKNTAHNARVGETLQVFLRSDRYTAASNWFFPMHWRPDLPVTEDNQP